MIELTSLQYSAAFVIGALFYIIFKTIIVEAISILKEHYTTKEPVIVLDFNNHTVIKKRS